MRSIAKILLVPLGLAALGAVSPALAAAKDGPELGECTKIGLVMSPIAMEATAGEIAKDYPAAAAAAAAEATPEYFATLHKQAKAVLQLAASVTTPDPKRDMRIAGNELELMASRHEVSFTPRLMQAMTDYSAWMKAHCNGAAAQG